MCLMEEINFSRKKGQNRPSLLCTPLHSNILSWQQYEEKTFPPPTFLSPFFSRGARGPLFIGCQGKKLNSFARYHYTSIVA